MSKTVKVILWVAVAVVVIGGVWWWMTSTGGAPGGQSPVTANQQPAAPSPAAPAANPNSAPAPAPSTVSDNSNASLNQDLSNIDSQMDGMQSDTATINQGLNDQPISQ